MTNEITVRKVAPATRHSPADVLLQFVSLSYTSTEYSVVAFATIEEIGALA